MAVARRNNNGISARRCACVVFPSSGNVLLLAAARGLSSFPRKSISAHLSGQCLKFPFILPAARIFFSPLHHTITGLLFSPHYFLIEHGSQDHGEDALGRPTGLISRLVLDLVAAQAERLPGTLWSRTIGLVFFHGN